jgi:hypothetical protein
MPQPSPAAPVLLDSLRPQALGPQGLLGEPTDHLGPWGPDAQETQVPRLQPILQPARPLVLRLARSLDGPGTTQMSLGRTRWLN